MQRLATHDKAPWWHYAVTWMTGVWISALLTPAILWAGRRFPIARDNWLKPAGLHILFSVLFSLSEVMLHSVILTSLHVFPLLITSLNAAFVALLILGFHENVVSYWAILGIQAAIGYYRGYQDRRQQALRLELQSSELTRQLAQAQLSALNVQLQPHFLFNTLNAIMVLVRQKRANEAEEMLSRLSDLLRSVLQNVNSPEVQLRRELHYVELYLSIEQVRFQDRLQIEVTAIPSVLEAAIPYMCLQPIVENAIRHGIGQSSNAETISVNAYREGDSLIVKVQDDGPGLSFKAAGRKGIGLSNARARLHQLYGTNASLTVENGESAGAVATVTLPFRLIANDEIDGVMELNAVQSVNRG